MEDISPKGTSCFLQGPIGVLFFGTNKLFIQDSEIEIGTVIRIQPYSLWVSRHMNNVGD